MRLFKRSQKVEAPLTKTWGESQKYELEHAVGFMAEPFFRELHQKFIDGRLRVSGGYRDDLMLREFFGGSRQEFEAFLGHIANKSCLDVGPCVMSQIAGWDVARSRFVIEPLLDPIVDWQRANLGHTAYEGIKGFAQPAEQLVEELVGAIDGAIVCRNMLDHTPKWPFVLANIAAYAAPGCKLLLWSDLDHRGESDIGHYDITPDTDSFKRFVAQLGFRIVREYSATDRHELNWGCFAERL